MFTRKTFCSNIFYASFNIIKKNHDFQTICRQKNHSTFHKWILDYFKNQPNYNKFVLKQPDVIFNNSVKTISTDELLIKFSATNSKLLFHEIDGELVNRVNDMTINQILALMDASLSDKKQLHISSRAFIKCLEIMNEFWFRRPDLTVSQTIQLIYYVSIYKKQSKSIVEFGLKKLMNEINYVKQLTNEELSILAVATYKSNAKVYDKMLRIFSFRIEKNLNQLIKNPLHFVSLIKPLKKAKYHDPVLLSRLTTAFNDNNNNILNNTTSSIYLLEYLADANCSDVKFLQQLVDSVGNVMVKDNLNNYRIKDVSSYVFSASYSGLSPKDPEVCLTIIDFLNQIFDTKEKCRKHSKLLIGTCLSLWMLDYKPIKLIKFIFSEVSVATLRKPNSHKQDNRLNLLLKSVYIERPDLIMGCQLIEESLNSMPDALNHLGERPFLVKVFQMLQELSNNLDILKIEYSFSIPCLKILGIKVIKNNSDVLYVEALDNSTCLYNTNIPNGMMKLKFRLGSKLNFKIISVSYKENFLRDPNSLKCYLESLLTKT